MLKKAGVLTAITAGMLLAASPAYAGESRSDDLGHMMDAVHEIETDNQVGLINMEDSELLSDINLCHLDVNVIAVPILSNNDSGVCANVDVEEDEDEHHHHGDHHHGDHDED